MGANRGTRDDGGSSAVEFALILPLFLLLVLGMIDFGRAYNAQLALTEAAREGVRPIALREAGANATTTTRAAIPAGSGINAANVAVTAVTCPSGALSAPVPNATVTAQLTFTFITPGLGTIANLARRGGGANALGGAFVLRGQGVMRCGG